VSKVTGVWDDVHQERQALLELLETLTPEQWDAASLCTEWRVREVAAHMVGETRMTVAQTALGVHHIGVPNQPVHRQRCSTARRRPRRHPARGFPRRVPAGTHLPGLSSLAMLEDIVIHQMGIRQALDEPRCIPNRRMIPVATDLWTNRFFPGPKLFRGLRKIATDAAWTAGQGPRSPGLSRH